MLAEVVRGLSARPRWLPSKLFYDEAGSRLFDRICELPEYYPTRTEIAIMRAHAAAMARALGTACLVVELGSGSSLKTGLLLDQLVELAAWVPVDISQEHLLRTTDSFRRDRPSLEILPVHADFTGDFEIPVPRRPVRRTVVYFPGSTVGNFTPSETATFLEATARRCGPGGALLIGVDLRKDPAVLHAAYNDSAGVTAEFNKNVLAHLNRGLGADFDLDAFEHRAFYDGATGRIEMHLDSLCDQEVHIDGRTFFFDAGESIRTEYSYKYTVDDFRAVAARAGFSPVDVWTDADDLFAVHLFDVPA